MRQQHLIAVAAAFALFFTLPVHAQKLFTRDGVVSFEEAKAAREAKREERARARFNRQDANGDGVVTVDEIGGRAAKMFERLDANGDGVVTRDELPRRGGHHRGKGHHHQAESE